MKNRKNEKVKIINIILNNADWLFGLGDDGEVYVWNQDGGIWYRYDSFIEDED